MNYIKKDKNAGKFALNASTDFLKTLSDFFKYIISFVNTVFFGGVKHATTLRLIRDERLRLANFVSVLFSLGPTGRGRANASRAKKVRAV